MAAKSITILILACLPAAALDIPQDVETLAREYRQRQTALETQFKADLTAVLASLGKKYATREPAKAVQAELIRLAPLDAGQILTGDNSPESAPPCAALNFEAIQAELSGDLERKPDGNDSILLFGSKRNAAATWTAVIPETGWYRLDIAAEPLQPEPAALTIKTGSTQFTWTPPGAGALPSTIALPVARMHLEQGTQALSLALAPGTNDTRSEASVGIRRLRLVRQERQPAGRSPAASLEQDEMQTLANLLATRYRMSASALREGYQPRIAELKTKYGQHANAAYVKSAALVLNALDTPSILEDVKAMRDDPAPAGTPFKPEKNFLQGKWKQQEGQNEYVFWSTGRFAFYENGKRNNRLIEKRYEYNPHSSTFYFENAQGFFETGIDVLGPDSIRIRRDTYLRVEDKKE